MRFQNPAGLWLLLGVPVLVLIWLIRPRHEERRVSSSYIWRLSDRFMKRRLPVSRLRRWLVFALQLLLVTGGAFLASRPVLEHGARVDYFLILDSSASMRTVTESGETRYEAACGMIREVSKRAAADGHTVTLVSAGDRAEVLVRESSSAGEISDALEGTLCGWSGCALSGAMTLAQLFLYEHPDAEVVLYTDQTAETEEAEELTVVRLDRGEWNAALTGFTVSQDGEGGLTVGAELTSFGRDAEIAVGLSVNGKMTDAVNMLCEADVPVSVRFSVGDSETVISLALEIDPGDAFSEDNRVVYYPERDRPCDTLLVSSMPFYLSAALRALNRGEARVIPPGSSSAAEGSFDFAVYDGCVPEEEPEVGAALLVNPPVLPDGLTAIGISDEPAPLTASAAGSAFQDKLLGGVRLDGVSVGRHLIADASDDWATVCSVGGDPAILARTMENGCALVVMLFDLHDSNLPLRTDFVGLLRNTVNLAVPPLIDRRIVAVGDRLTLRVLPNTGAVLVLSPDGSGAEVPESEDGAVIEVTLPGEYRLLTGGEETGFFASVPESESRPARTGPLSLLRDLPDGEGAAEAEEEREQAESGLWRAAAAVLLLILLTEWGIYLYEQS